MADAFILILANFFIVAGAFYGREETLSLRSKLVIAILILIGVTLARTVCLLH